jgi:hypothetical protein
MHLLRLQAQSIFAFEIFPYKNAPAYYPGFEPGPPRSEVRRANHYAIGAPP